MRRFSFSTTTTTLPKFINRWNTNTRFCSSTTSSSTSSSSSSSKFQYHIGKAAGILLPFSAVWFGSQYLFGPPVCQQEQPQEGEEGEVTIIQPSNPNNNNAAMLGGPFEMIDCASNKIVTDKETFNNSNKNDQKWSLLYFGFSKCAEVCPRNLKFMTDTVQSLSKDKDSNWQDKVQIVFVSVDPIRDKSDVLNKYLNERIPSDLHWKGLCGNQEQVSHICKSWRVYYSSMNESEEEQKAREAKGMSLEEALGSNNENYQLDHSAAVYFVAPGGKLRDLFFDEMGVKHAADRIDLHLSGAYSGLNKV